MDRSRSVLMLAREHLGGRNLIAGLVVLDAGLPLLAKPFSFPDLAGKIRAVLDGD